METSDGKIPSDLRNLKLMLRLTNRFLNIRGWSTTAFFFALLLAMSLPATGQDGQTSRPNPSPSRAQSSPAPAGPRPKQKSFSSPQDAAQALYSAAQNHDEDGLLVILGPDARDIIVWTDSPADRKADVDLFVEKYGQMHRLVKEPDNETTLYVGAENWPLPIPLVEKEGSWYFDSGLGKQEILYRRIGENELETIDVLHAMVDAENDYYSQVADSDGVHQYSLRFNSEPGRHDGLYWQDSNGSNESPIGPYLALASYNRSDRKPFRGYYFRILSGRGPQARGGAQDYIVNGKMTGGFAFVAFPAVYRSSGVKTFIVDESGAVYEKDLGAVTTQIAKSMTVYNPDSTWTKVQFQLGF
jgi:DUF2950 family protein